MNEALTMSQALTMNQTGIMKSAVYVGEIRHRRFQPVRHGLNYSLFMMYLDLDELPTLLKKH